MTARACGIEPAELRRKNLVATLPHTSITGEYFDSGDFVKVWDKLMSEVDLAGFREEQAAARARGRHIGIGFGIGVEISGVASELLVTMENRSEEHTSELQSLMRNSYTVVCLTKKTKTS